ncbi:hypothetical protein HMPREF2936_08640 [Neisseria sp. HMSC064F04]|nr:hypothetical protein HMPREF2936_08640 [Neisseria sp. HMSC064F04]
MIWRVRIKNNVGFTAIIFICTGAATVLHGTKARPALFLCGETVFVGKAHATKMGLSVSVGQTSHIANSLHL